MDRCYPTEADVAAATEHAWWLSFWLRVADEVHVPELGACWVWQGSTSMGYARFSNKGHRKGPVHRWLWEQEHGTVPEGLQLDHLCRVRSCIRPSHMEPVTARENVRRAAAARHARLRLG